MACSTQLLLTRTTILTAVGRRTVFGFRPEEAQLTGRRYGRNRVSRWPFYDGTVLDEGHSQAWWPLRRQLRHSWWRWTSFVLSPMGIFEKTAQGYKRASWGHCGTEIRLLFASIVIVWTNISFSFQQKGKTARSKISKHWRAHETSGRESLTNRESSLVSDHGL